MTLVDACSPEDQSSVVLWELYTLAMLGGLTICQTYHVMLQFPLRCLPLFLESPIASHSGIHTGLVSLILDILGVFSWRKEYVMAIDYSSKEFHGYNLVDKCCVKQSCCCSVTKSYQTLCVPMDCSLADFPVLHYLPEFAQTHVR